MSYIVEQKIKGRIYLYEVESYWDKDKKQPRQRRKYIGPKIGKKQPRISKTQSKLITKNFGSIVFLDFLSNKLGITRILKETFPDCYKEILGLAYYEITENTPMYLFSHWIEEQYLPDTKKLYSTDISKLFDAIGRYQTNRLEFFQKWIDWLKPSEGIYYDITSVSSYSTGIEFIEWGYNRDGENLQQINIGVVFSQKELLPIFYNIYPGSIVDVTTLQNTIKYLNLYNIKDVVLILDRGFFSKNNLKLLSKNNFEFIQPVPFRLKCVKQIISKNSRNIKKISSAFKYTNEILNYLKTKLDLDKEEYDAHIFFNEKSEIDQRHNFLHHILEIERSFEQRNFQTLTEFNKYKKSNIPEKYSKYFKWNSKSSEIEKDTRRIREHLNMMGYYLLLTNIESMEKDLILGHYRRRDCVEKLFDISKNEMDGDRLRVHSQINADGRLFIKFIAMILYSEISKNMNYTKLFEKYSLKELLFELKKLKITVIGNNEPIIGEITKKQKIIFEAFSITVDRVLHSY